MVLSGDPTGRGEEAGTVAVLISPHRVRLVLAGEVDASTEAELSEAVTEVLGLGLPVDIDVRNVTFMDSSAISGIARLSVQLGHRPRLIAPPESVRFLLSVTDRKSTRLNSSHVAISYAVFCVKKKKRDAINVAKDGRGGVLW